VQDYTNRSFTLSRVSWPVCVVLRCLTQVLEKIGATPIAALRRFVSSSVLSGV